MGRTSETESVTACYHCGEDCDDQTIRSEEKIFCCEGCKMVYGILSENNLCQYYDIEKNPGINQKIKVREGKFAFLDDAEVQKKLIHFEQHNQRHVTFYLPQVHCSSCIWLLEHLPKFDKGIISSQVNFLRKEVTVAFDISGSSLRKIAELLAAIGYEPHISLNDISGRSVKKYDKSRLYKIGIAGFCFGNIMLLSFPEYFASADLENTVLKKLFSYLNLALALPVFFYCAAEFFISAWKGLRQRFLNIDAPIALAVLITFGRSVYEITTGTGAGYFDSMSGIVFFMHIGRFLQNKSYQSLAFERDYTSYFPLGVTKLSENKEEINLPVSRLRVGDRIKIHSNEIVPADGILFMGKASIDYSFVTGESVPVDKSIGEIIYAGGKQTGGAIELEVVKEVSQSYLTQLWNNDTFTQKTAEKKVSFVHRVSRYFTYVLFSIAAITAVFWNLNDPAKVWPADTAILIVACPCALLLSATFTNGNMLSVLQGHGFYVKNSSVLESLSDADTIVFDKTGTISQQHAAEVLYEGEEPSTFQKQLIRSVALQSNHPLSRAIASALPVLAILKVKEFYEAGGSGISAVILGDTIRLGSAGFVNAPQYHGGEGSRVFVSINGQILGCFIVCVKYREHLRDVITGLRQKYQLAVISGDNDVEEPFLKEVFGNETLMRFHQSPQQKLEFIKELQSAGRKVIMIGDGLNDAGALQQSNAGIAISDDINNFSPGCDVIMHGRSFTGLRQLLVFCSKEKMIISGSFVLSILYNLIGLSFAVQGALSPLIAAILMPASSVSIMLFTTLSSTFYGKKISKVLIKHT